MDAQQHVLNLRFALYPDGGWILLHDEVDEEDLEIGSPEIRTVQIRWDSPVKTCDTL